MASPTLLSRQLPCRACAVVGSFRKSRRKTTVQGPRYSPPARQLASLRPFFSQPVAFAIATRLNQSHGLSKENRLVRSVSQAQISPSLAPALWKIPLSRGRADRQSATIAVLYQPTIRDQANYSCVSNLHTHQLYLLFLLSSGVEMKEFCPCVYCGILDTSYLRDHL